MNAPKLDLAAFEGHTQGGWNRNIKPAAKYPIIFAGRNTHVAQCITRGMSDAEQEANCALIAAAPALLAECRRLREALESMRSSRDANMLESANLTIRHDAISEALEVAHTTMGELLYLCDRHIDGAKDYREYAKSKRHLEQARAALKDAP